MYYRVFRRGLIIILYSLLIISLFLLYLWLSALGDNLRLQILMCSIQLCLTIGLSWMLSYGYFSPRFYINHKGVKFIKRDKTYSLEWKDIKSIGLARGYYGSINKKSFIYFDGREIDESLYRYEVLNIKHYNEKYFGVQYRKKIVDEIVKYWDEPIQGLYQVEGKNR